MLKLNDAIAFVLEIVSIILLTRWAYLLHSKCYVAKNICISTLFNNFCFCLV